MSQDRVSASTLRFGLFDVDVRTGELRKRGVRLGLQEQPFQILAMLLERPGDVVSRDALRQRLWAKDVFVDFDHSLNAAVQRLRELLGDTADNPRFIETLPRRGYRFIAPVQAPGHALLGQEGDLSRKSDGPAPQNGIVEGASVRAAAGAVLEVGRSRGLERKDAVPAQVSAFTRVEGIWKSTPQPVGGKARIAWSWRRTAVAVAVVAVLALGAWWALAPKTGSYTIAVLPFRNLSTEPGSDYFSDGLTDELIRNLSIIQGMEVKSRTSSFTFKDNPRNIREVGSQLGVTLVLEGSILRIGQQLRINAQLVRVRDEFPLWSGRFDRQLTDVFAIQDEISRGIVNSLRLNLGRGRRRYETSVEAYDLYLRARAALDAQHVPIDPIIDGFGQAVARDASFAPAYAGLAMSYAGRSMAFPPNHPPDELANMRWAAEKAIELDPLLAEAHDALGIVLMREGQWERADQSFRRAIALDRNRSDTYVDYADGLLVVLGRTEEALQHLRVAATLDPLSAQVHNALAVDLLLVGQYDQAAEECQKLPIDFGVGYRNMTRARARLGQGRIREAIEILEHEPNLARNPQLRGLLGYAYARAGQRDKAEEMARVSSYANEHALIFAGLADKERTLEALERMTALGAYRAARYIIYPELALLRGDARLRAFRKKLGLPD